MLTEWIVSQVSPRQVASTGARLVSSPPDELKILRSHHMENITHRSQDAWPEAQPSCLTSTLQRRTKDYWVLYGSLKSLQNFVENFLDLLFHIQGSTSARGMSWLHGALSLPTPSLLQNMDTALPETRTDSNTRMSPPSPAFSLDSSSPFANGLHFESILFEDEEDDEDTGPRSSHEKPRSIPVDDISPSTNPKQRFAILDRHHSLSKGKRRTKAWMSVKQDGNRAEESGGDGDPGCLECVRDDVTPASSRF